VRYERHAPRDQDRDDLPRYVLALHHDRHDYHRARRSDEGVDRVPDVVDGGNFIRYYFDDEEDAGDYEHRPARENVELRPQHRRPGELFY
jgi:hypothetical protein